MPESTCLHIQDRESGPIRVVELPWISVRIGRAAFCEVRLADQELGAEACRLTRRGRIWSLTPIGSRSLVELEGRMVKSPCPLPFGVPFRIGSYYLTLRQDLGAEPDWEMYPASAPSQLSADVTPPAREAGERAEPGTTSSPGPAEPEARARRDRTIWDARWKAAEAHLKSRSEGLLVSGEEPRGSHPSTFDAMPARERPAAVVRPVGGSAPLIDPAARPIPTPRAPRIEPTWSTPRSDPPVVAPRLDPTDRPVPASAAARYQPAWTGPPAQAPAPPVELTPTATDEKGPELDHPEVSPAPMTDGNTYESVAADATPPVDWLARNDDPEISTPLSRAADAESVPAPEPMSEHPLETLPGNTGTPECVSEPEVSFAADSVSQEEPPPIAERLEARAEPGAHRLFDDLQTAATGQDRSGPIRDERARTGRPGAPSWEPFQDASRPVGPEPKKRKATRDRIGLERRTRTPRGSRPVDRAASSDSKRDATAAPVDEVVWPSVKDILPNHGAHLGPPPTVARARKSRQPLPTVPREPAQWMLPVWLAWPPVAVSVLVLGLGASVLSWTWAADSSAASVVTQRLMRSDGSSRHKPLPDWVVPPDGRWLTTTSQHMAHWAVYLSGAGGVEKGSVPDVSEMLTKSLEISPLNPTARLARARLETSSGAEASLSVHNLGLSRDAVSLAWSARRLLDSGKQEAALRLYGQALSAASGGGFSRTATPRYDDDENARRYLLPGEDAVRDIVTEMDKQAWSFREWSKALPRNPTVLLATARLLHEQDRAEAEPLLALILKSEPSSSGAAADPRAVAARAEALALGSHWKEAEQEYRQAIELADNDLIRRSWWFNLADIALRLNDEPQQRAAIRAVLAVPTSDEDYAPSILDSAHG